mmetsp:Transcript_9025/g.24373  ORF Transcript_9025/g.24373 Transcript_9025/m.24373 type:complete len:220 (+) Transcript_9025:313-972(+)
MQSVDLGRAEGLEPIFIGDAEAVGAEADAPALLELRRRAGHGPTEVGAREVVLAPFSRQPAVLTTLLEVRRLAVVEEFFDGLQSRRLEDDTRQHGVLASFRRPRPNEELIDYFALRRVGGQEVGTEALEDLVPLRKRGRVVLEDADRVARAAQRFRGVGAGQTQRLLCQGFWHQQGARSRSGAARQQVPARLQHHGRRIAQGGRATDEQCGLHGCVSAL